MIPVDLEDIARIVGARQVLEGEAIDERYKRDLIGQYTSDPFAVVRPASADEVAAVVSHAAARHIPVVAVGGETGLSGGAVAVSGIKLSLERMNRIIEIDRDAMTMTLEAGVTVQAAQEAAEAAGLFLPLDLGSRGSATIGGAISTNAGGNRVLRWGTMRDMVLGIEAVLADGTKVSSLGKILKDNAGYDWKHWLIGTEGTLGIVTGAVLRLRALPAGSQTAMIAVDDFEGVIATFRHLDLALSGLLSSFEAMWGMFYDHVAPFHEKKGPLPLARGMPFYCLAELLGSGGDRDQELFQSALEHLLDAGIARDVVIAQSEREREALWAIREDLIEVTDAMPGFHGYDVGIARPAMAPFVTAVEAGIRQQFPDATVLAYGHIGDGNLHFLVAPARPTEGFGKASDDLIFGLVAEVGGSITAEHGVGLSKREYLPASRSAPELALMRTIKRALDPHCILNPGKVFEMPEAVRG